MSIVSLCNKINVSVCCLARCTIKKRNILSALVDNNLDRMMLSMHKIVVKELDNLLYINTIRPFNILTSTKSPPFLDYNNYYCFTATIAEGLLLNSNTLAEIDNYRQLRLL